MSREVRRLQEILRPLVHSNRLLRTVAWVLGITFLTLGAYGDVVINEVFYAPPDKTRPIEFIELFNASDTPADIGNWRFSDGVKFVFPGKTSIPAKGFLCIAANPAAFEKAFGFSPLGPWTGKLKNGGERIQLANASGRKIDEVTYEVGHPWPTQAHGKGPALELINAKLDRKTAGAWRAGGPTPGKANSVAAENAPPMIGEVVHSPTQPKAGNLISITAQVTDPDGVKSVVLAYQSLEPGKYIRRTDDAFEKSWIDLPMRDDGQSGDSRSGDGVYTATLPPGLATHRRLIRYRIIATDEKGMSGRAPGTGDSVPNFALFIYNGVPAWTGANRPGKSEAITVPAGLLDSLPTFHLIADAEDVQRSQWDGGWNHRKCTGTLVFEGKVYDHITFHNRGRASTYNTGKNKWGFHFPEGHELTMRDPTGRKLKKKWDAFSMNACASPWVPAHRGMAGLDEWFSSQIYSLAGVPAPRHIPVHFRVIDEAEEAPEKDQYNGDLWGLYMAIEDPDGSFLDERDLPDGNIYTNESGNKKHQSPTQPKDRSDLDAFMNASRGDKDEAWWREHLDLPRFYSFQAANRITGNVDLREGCNHYLYHAPDGRWVPIPWDLDMMLIPRTHQSGRIDQERCLNHKALRTEYANRCRELLDLLLDDTSPNGGQVGQLVDEYAALIAPKGQEHSWAELDMAKWNYHPRTAGKGVFYQNPMPDGRMGGSWERKLQTADFKGMCRFVLEYASNARPADAGWKLNDGEPRGYGYGYLRAEAEDPEVPARPTITYAGAPGFPANALKFQCSAFDDPQGANTFASLQWRIGEIAAPGVAGWSAGKPRRYEIEPLWTSPEITSFSNTIQIPGHLPNRGTTYRVRIRMKDSSGRWSRWSEAVTFVAGSPVSLTQVP
ncbi:MAG: hypothetical protein EOP84_06340 [Verrucomicrobiaceae bacterium]|nr:MAG: hypothetical protein EOP84_06340 [Verrucomicrobiaceae bacterium]